jgi:putative ABC transport system permease protein
MILFRLISWPYVRQHALRSALTVAGIALGIAVFVSMRAANAEVFETFETTVAQLAGRTQLQVTAGAPGFDEGVLDRVQALDQVAAAAPVIEAVAGTGLPGQGSLLILGVDMTGDRSLRDYDFEGGEAAVVDDPLVFLAQPDSIIVTAEFASRNHLDVNTRLPLDTAEGRRSFTVRGLLRRGGFADAFGGNLAIMDIYAAEQVFGRGRTFDRLDIALAPGVDIETGRRAIAAALGPVYRVEPPATRGESFQSLLRIYDLMLNFSSAFALAVGMFIIYHASALAVAERRREIGILRALGAFRGQIVALVIGEYALGGLIGSTLGVLGGYAIAGAIAHGISGVATGLYGVHMGTIDVIPRPGLVALAVAIGTVTSIIAAALPAAAAALVDPVRALQKGPWQAVSARESRFRLVAAVVLGPAGALLVMSTRTIVPFYAGYLGVLIAALLLTPPLAVWLVRRLRPALCRLSPVEGALAADSLLGAPRRASATMTALMLALTLVIGLGGLARASYRSISEWATNALNPDFFVTGSPTLTGLDYRFPDAMGTALAAVPGIREVQRMRQARLDFQDGPILLMATDVARLGTTSPRTALEGDREEMYRRAAAGQGVIASENFASLRHLHLGATVNLPTPTGPLTLPIVGVVRDYADQQGSLMMDLSLYRARWGDTSVDHFRVFLNAGADAETVRGAILSRFSGNHRLFVLSTREVRRYVMAVTDQWFNMTWVQIAVAVVVAILGIVQSLSVAIADRRRDFGVLRAVGAFRSQIRRAIWVEAATMAAVSLVLGLAFGAIHLYFVLEMSSRDYPGLRFDYTYPYGVALLVLPIIVGAAWLAALGPAESAVRVPLVEALEYE